MKRERERERRDDKTAIQRKEHKTRYKDIRRNIAIKIRCMSVFLVLPSMPFLYILCNCKMEKRFVKEFSIEKGVKIREERK